MIHSVIHQVFTECLLHARHCSRHRDMAVNATDQMHPPAKKKVIPRKRREASRIISPTEGIY